LSGPASGEHLPGPELRYAFNLADAGTQPAICLRATADGDQAATNAALHDAFTGSGVRTSRSPDASGATAQERLPACRLK
jgi:hypothetical protein